MKTLTPFRSSTNLFSKGDRRVGVPPYIRCADGAAQEMDLDAFMLDIERLAGVSTDRSKGVIMAASHVKRRKGVSWSLEPHCLEFNASWCKHGGAKFYPSTSASPSM